MQSPGGKKGPCSGEAGDSSSMDGASRVLGGPEGDEMRRGYSQVMEGEGSCCLAVMEIEYASMLEMCLLCEGVA